MFVRPFFAVGWGGGFTCRQVHLSILMAAFGGAAVHPPVRVRVTDRGFEPQHVTTSKGRPVSFRIVGSLSHILIGPGLSASPLLRPGGCFEFTFSESGELRDEVLSFVRGTVEVTSGESLSQLPPDVDVPTADGDVDVPIAKAPAALPPASAPGPPEPDADAVPPPASEAPTTVTEPGPRAGRWSGISWATVQSRYRQLKAEFSVVEGEQPRAMQQEKEEEKREEGREGEATAADVDADAPRRRARPSSSARRRAPATAIRSLVLSSSEEEGEGEEEETTHDARRRLKLDSERLVLASRSGPPSTHHSPPATAACTCTCALAMSLSGTSSSTSSSGMPIASSAAAAAVAGGSRAAARSEATRRPRPTRPCQASSPPADDPVYMYVDEPTSQPPPPPLPSSPPAHPVEVLSLERDGGSRGRERATRQGTSARGEPGAGCEASLGRAASPRLDAWSTPPRDPAAARHAPAAAGARSVAAEEGGGGGEAGGGEAGGGEAGGGGRPRGCAIRATQSMATLHPPSALAASALAAASHSSRAPSSPLAGSCSHACLQLRRASGSSSLPSTAPSGAASDTATAHANPPPPAGISFRPLPQPLPARPIRSAAERANDSYHHDAASSGGGACAGAAADAGAAAAAGQPAARIGSFARAISSSSTSSGALARTISAPVLGGGGHPVVGGRMGGYLGSSADERCDEALHSFAGGRLSSGLVLPPKGGGMRRAGAHEVRKLPPLPLTSLGANDATWLVTDAAASQPPSRGNSR